MPKVQQFLDLLDQMKEIHIKKNDDYAGNSNPFENFERSAQISEWFNDPVDKSFTVLIGTKLARLATLLNRKEGVPNNESIDDSFLDLTVYCGLWGSYRKFKSGSKSSSEYYFTCEQCGGTTKDPIVQQDKNLRSHYFDYDNCKFNWISSHLNLFHSTIKSIYEEGSRQS